MTNRQRLGGVIHTYQKYDPQKFPSPTQPPPDAVSPAFEHMLMFGSRRRLTEEELARAVRIDPSQIAGLGPSLDALMAMLLERKRKILAKYETDTVQQQAGREFRQLGERLAPPKRHRARFELAYREEQIYQLERLWYAVGDDRSPFARGLVQLIESLGAKYQVDELAAKYEFTGRTPLTVPEALAVKQELEKIDELLKQLEEASRTAQIAVHRPGVAGRVHRTRGHGEASRAAADGRGLRARSGGAARLGTRRGRFSLDPAGLPAVSGTPLGADFQQPAALAHGTPRRPRAGRGGGRTAEDEALRVR